RESNLGPFPYGPYLGLGSNLNRAALGESNASVQYVPTTGSILILNFAEVIQLTEELYAPGSLGSFNLQLQVTVENNHNYKLAGNDIRAGHHGHELRRIRERAQRLFDLPWSPH
ncbi:MAG: major capsid protein V20 domain-containing protein, partial [Candidatus Fonsibacter sp.]